MFFEIHVMSQKEKAEVERCAYLLILFSFGNRIHDLSLTHLLLASQPTPLHETIYTQGGNKGQPCSVR